MYNVKSLTSAFLKLVEMAFEMKESSTFESFFLDDVKK